MFPSSCLRETFIDASEVWHGADSAGVYANVYTLSCYFSPHIDICGNEYTVKWFDAGKSH